MLKKLLQDFILGLAQSSTQVVQVGFLAGSITFSQVALEIGLAPELSTYLPFDKEVVVGESSNKDKSYSKSQGFFASQAAVEVQDLESGFRWTSKDFDQSELMALFEQDRSQVSFIQSVNSSPLSPPLVVSVQSFTQMTPATSVASFSFFELAQKQNARSPASSPQFSIASRIFQRTQDLMQVMTSKTVEALHKDVTAVPANLVAKTQGPVEISAPDSPPSPSASISSSNSSRATTVPIVETQPSTPTTVPVAEMEPSVPTTTVPVEVVEQPTDEPNSVVEDLPTPTVQKKKILVISDESSSSSDRAWSSLFTEDQFEVHLIGRGESVPVSFDQFDLLILNLNQALQPSDARALRELGTPILTCQPNTAVELGFVSVTDQAKPNNKKDIRITNLTHTLFEGLNLSNQFSIFSQLVPVAFAERAIESATVLASWSSAPQADRTLVFIDAGTQLNNGGVSGGHRGFYPCSNLARKNYSVIGETLLKRSANYLMRPAAE